MTNPNTAYLKSAVGNISDNDALSADFHAFEYYMGEKCVQGTGQIGSGYHAKFSTDVAKIVIMKFLKDEIQTHQTRASQWETRPELESDKGTKEYKIMVEHRHNDAILTSHMQDKEVFPFAPYEATSKLYQVVNKTSDAKSATPYVLASMGGIEILDTWDGQDENKQFYKLEGTDPVEYIKGESCQDPSLFEVVSQEYENTIDWRITVKTKETGEITEGVYPFNLNGSLYQINDDWVLASCGGTEIVASWDGQEDNQLYKLEGTDEIIKTNMQVMSYSDIKFVYYPLCDWNSWCAFYRNIKVYIIGTREGEDRVISSYNRVPLRGGIQMSYKSYSNLKPSGYQQGSIFFQTDDINELRSKIGTSIQLSNRKFTTNFTLIESDFDKIVE